MFASFIMLTDAISMCNISGSGGGYLHRSHALRKATFSYQWTAQVVFEVHPKAAFLNQSASSKRTLRRFPELNSTILHPNLLHCMFSVGYLAKLQSAPTPWPRGRLAPCIWSARDSTISAGHYLACALRHDATPTRKFSLHGSSEVTWHIWLFRSTQASQYSQQWNIHMTSLRQSCPPVSRACTLWECNC